MSAYEAQVYREKVGAPRCAAHVIVNGVGPEEFEPVVEIADPADFLFIGALRDLKGVDTFIEAMLALNGSGSRATGVIVGAGEAADERRYRRMAEPLGSAISFLAPMPAREAFALARNVVVPSRAESMPYIVLEAVAAGRPLLATHVGGIPEVLDGPAEGLLPPGDPVALAEAMQSALRLPERIRAQAASRRERLRQRFSLSAMTVRIEAIYRGALESRKERTAASAMEADSAS